MQTITGGLPSVLLNSEGLYEGDLKHYFRVVQTFARNLNKPYHNFRHMMHVVYMCHEALRYYSKTENPFDKATARTLLIAAMFHDFDHTGLAGNDDLNIELAVRGFRKHVAGIDNFKNRVDEVERLMRWTEFPHMVRSSAISQVGRVLRDADVSQALSISWYQQVIVGLSEEQRRPQIEVLADQKTFLANLKFQTVWGRETFSEESIQEKIHEAEELLMILRGF